MVPVVALAPACSRASAHAFRAEQPPRSVRPTPWGQLGVLGRLCNPTHHGECLMQWLVVCSEPCTIATFRASTTARTLHLRPAARWPQPEARESPPFCGPSCLNHAARAVGVLFSFGIAFLISSLLYLLVPLLDSSLWMNNIPSHRNAHFIPCF